MLRESNTRIRPVHKTRARKSALRSQNMQNQTHDHLVERMGLHVHHARLIHALDGQRGLWGGCHPETRCAARTGAGRSTGRCGGSAAGPQQQLGVPPNVAPLRHPRRAARGHGHHGRAAGTAEVSRRPEGAVPVDHPGPDEGVGQGVGPDLPTRRASVRICRR
jgi:hypothetical protein